MNPITAQAPLARSLDVVTDNTQRLQQLFPEAFTEGKVDMDVLRQLLGENVDDKEEKYGLNWHGKRRARQIALTPSTGTLRPVPADSIEWDSTENLMIEGDNLEVLKLLQKSYAGQVKLIYIDPPYNTGKDFVYPDNFQDSIKNYQELTGQREGGKKISSNAESSGRFHTDWLNMIYPRLKLAKNLLRSDGAILVSLDDTESANIRVVLNEIFGEESFVGVFSWKSRTAKADVPFGVSQDIEWVIAYANADFLAGREGERKYYKSDDYEDRWRLSDLTTNKSKDERPNSFFTMKNPKNGEGFPASEIRTWAVTTDTFDEYYKRGKIVFPGDYSFLSIKRPAFRVFEREDKEKAMAKYGSDDVRMSISTHLPEKEVGRTEHGSKEIRDLFVNQVFNFPKPTSLIRHFVSNTTGGEDIILDFFAGSGTTGHAVVAQNAADGNNRRFILVQLPEPLDPASKEQKTAADFCSALGKPFNIAELTKERLRRAFQVVRKENPKFKGDLGFRVYKQDSTNIRPWDPNPQDITGSLFAAQEHLKDDRTEQDILTELLLKLGLPLTVPIEERAFGSHTLYAVGAGTLMACLSPRIEKEEVEALAQGMVAWQKELAPVGDSQVVLRDSAFRTDVAKANFTAILEQAGFDKRNIRSL